MAARKQKQNINDLTANALKSAKPTEETETTDGGDASILDQLEAEAAEEPEPKVTREDPAKVFSMAAQRLVHNIHMVSDPKIKTGEVVSGEPVYMTEFEMFKAYKKVIAEFRTKLVSLPEPGRAICFSHLRNIESMTRQVRFNRATSQTTLMRQRHNLKLNIMAAVKECHQELAAKLPKQASA